VLPTPLDDYDQLFGNSSDVKSPVVNETLAAKLMAQDFSKAICSNSLDVINPKIEKPPHQQTKIEGFFKSTNSPKTTPMKVISSKSTTDFEISTATELVTPIPSPVNSETNPI